MPVYQYKVIDDEGHHSSGTIRANSPRDARDLLRSEGKRVKKLDEAESQTRSWLIRPSNAAISQALSDLAVLLGVGTPLDEALTIISQQYHGPMRKIWQQLLDEVATGRSLSAAMADQEDVFNKLTVAMVQVGENAGNLDEILGQLGRYEIRAASQKGKVLNAILYPAIIFVVASGVTVFLMTNVLPSLLDNLTDLGKDLPWPTRVVSACSDFLVNYWPLLLLTFFLLFCLAWYIYSRPKGRLMSDLSLLKLPILGNLVVKQELSRVSLVLSVLLKSGMEFVEAIELAKESTRNRRLRLTLEECRRATERGKEIAESMREEAWIPPVVVQVFAMGQSTGHLDDLLHKLSDDYDRQVEMAITRLTGLIEPILIVTLSLIIGFVVFATFLPILEAGNVL